LMRLSRRNPIRGLDETGRNELKKKPLMMRGFQYADRLSTISQSA
jgi:hypothetical protein